MRQGRSTHSSHKAFAHKRTASGRCWMHRHFRARLRTCTLTSRGCAWRMLQPQCSVSTSAVCWAEAHWAQHILPGWNTQARMLHFDRCMVSTLHFKRYSCILLYFMWIAHVLIPIAAFVLTPARMHAGCLAGRRWRSSLLPQDQPRSSN